MDGPSQTSLYAWQASLKKLSSGPGTNQCCPSSGAYSAVFILYCIGFSFFGRYSFNGDNATARSV